MNLSYRLTEVKNMVSPCDTVCDIGCDHGYVSMALVTEKLAKKVIACDVNKGPLEAARKNIEAEALSSFVETRLGDGLHKISPSDNPDAIVIAGMGGRLMERILTESPSVVECVNQLVLQPQSELFLVRKWIRENGFFIFREKALVDEGKYYFIIDARRDSLKDTLCKEDSFDISYDEAKFTEKELGLIYDTYSEYLIKNRDLVLKEYLERTISNNNMYLAGIKEEKKGELTAKNELIKKVLRLMGD